jgi:hypothetical protein
MLFSNHYTSYLLSDVYFRNCEYGKAANQLEELRSNIYTFEKPDWDFKLHGF